MCETFFWRLEPRSLPSTPYKYLYLLNDYYTKSVQWYNFFLICYFLTKKKKKLLYKRKQTPIFHKRFGLVAQKQNPLSLYQNRLCNCHAKKTHMHIMLICQIKNLTQLASQEVKVFLYFEIFLFYFQLKGQLIRTLVIKFR